MQLDGNESVPSETSQENIDKDDDDNVDQDVPRTASSRNPRVLQSRAMPVIAVANARSLQPKLKSTIEKIENEDIDILVVVEVWEKTGKKNKYFQSKVEEMAELRGLKYISSGAKPSGKRGGGTGIISRNLLWTK